MGEQRKELEGHRCAAMPRGDREHCSLGLPSSSPRRRHSGDGPAVSGHGVSVVLGGSVRSRAAYWESPSFDSTSWGTGNAAFGSGGEAVLCSLPRRDALDVNTDMLLRKDRSPAGPVASGVSIAVDNDANVYWNGALVAWPPTVVVRRTTTTNFGS